jgi:dTDP-4-amino-4,6-dideoxygalactose transaminase
MTTGGEGGLVVLADRAAWQRAWSHRDNGKDYDSVFGPHHAVGYRWVYTGFGTNARMSEMQAAIGLRQLPKVAGWVAARAANAALLAAALAEYPCAVVVPLPPGHEHAYYRFAFRLEPRRLNPGWNRDRVMTALTAEGIPCFAGPCPEIYLERAYAGGPETERTGAVPRRPNAAYLRDVSLTLLVHPTLDASFLNDCRAAIRKVFSAATRPSGPSPRLPRRSAEMPKR